MELVLEAGVDGAVELVLEAGDDAVEVGVAGPTDPLLFLQGVEACSL